MRKTLENQDDTKIKVWNYHHLRRRDATVAIAMERRTDACLWMEEGAPPEGSLVGR